MLIPNSLKKGGFQNIIKLIPHISRSWIPKSQNLVPQISINWIPRFQKMPPKISKVGSQKYQKVGSQNIKNGIPKYQKVGSPKYPKWDPTISTSWIPISQKIGSQNFQEMDSQNLKVGHTETGKPYSRPRTDIYAKSRGDALALPLTDFHRPSREKLASCVLSFL